MNFSEKLLNFRAKHDLSQKKASKILGVKNVKTIAKWESGVSQPTKKNEEKALQLMREYEDVEM